MSTGGRAGLRAFAHRRAPRCPLAIPVRITMLRGGMPQSISGRAVNLGEGGMAISVAEEFRASDTLAVEFLLPDLGLGLQVRAVPRYRVASHSGLEFRGLTRHQQAVIREWTRQRQSLPEQSVCASPERDSSEREKREKPVPRWTRFYPQVPDQVLRLLWAVLAVLALAGLMVWWQWERAWKELDDQTHQMISQMAPVPRMEPEVPAYFAFADGALLSPIPDEIS